MGNFEQATPPTARRVLRTLVVDDAPVNRVLLCLFIEGHGHAVKQTDGGAAAVKHVGAGGIDVVFMDVSMLDVDGLEATRRIRQLSGTAGCTPVWAVTALASPSEVAQCLDTGMDGHFSKPVNLRRLLHELLRGLQSTEGSNTPYGMAPRC